MKLRRIIMLLMLLLVGLTACSPGHLGSNVLAFVKDGHLWTADPDGANAFAIVSQDTPVVGYTWSPTHQILSFRTLDVDYAKTQAARHLQQHAINGQFSDLPSILHTIGVDGGTPIDIAFSQPDVQYSNTMWNSDGSRLLYRQTATTFTGNPASANWWVSQNDQPGGIAAKSLPASFSIPSISYANHNYMIIGNSHHGIFTTTLAGTHLREITHSVLPDHPLPATLERVLWRPGHTDQFLYAVPSTTTEASTKTTSYSIQLILSSINGNQTTITDCSCNQFAWSPDGNHLLYAIGSTFFVRNVQQKNTYTFYAETDSIPYWSPDGRFLVLDGPHNLILINIMQQQQTLLLSDTQAPQQLSIEPGTLPATNVLLQPVANNIWSADSQHFLFLTHHRLFWHTHHQNQGLYTVSIDTHGQVQGSPVLVDKGNITQAGWTYQDPNTSFLY